MRSLDKLGMTSIGQTGSPKHYDPIDVSTSDWNRISGEPQAPARDGSFTLLAGNAELIGNKISYMSGWAALGYWKKSDSAQWNLEGVQSGEYEVELCCAAGEGSRTYAVEAGDSKIEAITKTTGDGIYIAQNIGSIMRFCR